MVALRGAAWGLRAGGAGWDVPALAPLAPPRGRRAQPPHPRPTNLVAVLGSPLKFVPSDGMAEAGSAGLPALDDFDH